MESQQEPLRW